MRHFDANRRLVEDDCSEFWNDLEYMPTMDAAWHAWMQPEYDEARRVWKKRVEE